MRWPATLRGRVALCVLVFGALWVPLVVGAIARGDAVGAGGLVVMYVFSVVGVAAPDSRS